MMQAGITEKHGESRFRYLGDSGISDLVIEDRWGDEVTVRVADVVAFLVASGLVVPAPSRRKP